MLKNLLNQQILESLKEYELEVLVEALGALTVIQSMEVPQLNALKMAVANKINAINQGMKGITISLPSHPVSLKSGHETAPFSVSTAHLTAMATGK